MYQKFSEWLASIPKPSLPQGFSWQEQYIICSHDGTRMVYVPNGIFIMGSEEFLVSRPQHQVYLDSYLIDECPVTNAQFQKFIAAGGYEEEKYWLPSGWKICQEEGWKRPRYWEFAPWNNPLHPVVGVSWYEADAYSRWANKRLPTEAEWEKAARGGIWLDGDNFPKIRNLIHKRHYPWGDELPNFENVIRAVYKEEQTYGNRSTAPVGLYTLGSSVYGCLDMSGNVWEWCSDWYQRDYYSKSPAKNPLGPESGDSKILRGGSWCREARQLDISFRTKDEPHNGGWDLSGFRCAKSIS